MAASVPTVEPTVITAGDTLTFTKSLPDYLPADSWALTYSLVMGGNLISITSSDNGDGTHLVLVTAANTAPYKPGQYQWQSYVTKTTQRFQVGFGNIEIKPDFAAQAAGLDARSFAESELERVEGEIRKLRAHDSLSIRDRTKSDRAFADLLEARDYWKREVARVRREEKLAAGLASGRMILTRMPG